MTDSIQRLLNTTSLDTGTSKALGVILGAIESRIGNVSIDVTATPYGAKGDGITDDTAAIQAAIDDGNTFFPAGEYVISSTLTSPSNRRIWSNGDATIRAADSNASTFSLFSVSGAKENVVLENLVFDGRQSARQTGAAFGGVFFSEGAQYCKAINVTVRDCGILPANTPDGSTVDVGEGNGITIQVTESATRDTAHNEIIDCVVEDPNGQLAFGIRLYTNWTVNQEVSAYVNKCKGNTVRGNRIIGTSWNAIEIAGPATVQNTIDGNRSIGNVGNTGIEADKGASYNTYSNNVVSDSAFSPYQEACCFRDQGIASGGGAFPTRYATGNVWTNNVATNNTKRAGLAMTCFRVDYSASCSINNLIAKNFDTTGHTTGELKGLHIYSASDLRVANYEFSGMGALARKFGVLVNDETSNLSFVNCDITLENTVTNNTGFRFTGAIAGLSILGGSVINGESGVQIATSSVAVTDGRIIGMRLSGQTFAPLNFNATSCTFSGVVAQNVITTTGTYACRAVDTGTFIYNGNYANVHPFSSAATRQFAAGNLKPTGSNAGGGVRAVSYGTAAPSTGTWMVGDVVWHTTPAASTTVGWVCTTAGTPGTWKAMASLAA